MDKNTAARRWRRAEEERAALVRLARRRGLSPEDAEDCVQEAIVRVVPRPDLDEDRMGALLCTAVARLAIDMHRRSVAANRARTRLQGRANAGAGSGAGTAGDPATVVCDREEARWSARLTEQLPALQQRVLLARAEGVAVKDLARELSTTPKAVESLISRARAAMRSAMSSGLTAAAGLLRRWRTFGIGATTATAGVTAVMLTLPMISGGPHGAPSVPTELRDNAPRVAQLASATPATGTGAGHRHDGDHGDARRGHHGPPHADEPPPSAPPTTVVDVADVTITKERMEESELEATMRCIENDGLQVDVAPGAPGGPDLLTYYVRCDSNPNN